MLKYAAILDMPENKTPGYYAQLVKGLAELSPFDRDKELVIFETEKQLDALDPFLQKYGITYEAVMLDALPRNAKAGPQFDTCGFISKLEHMYVFCDSSAQFTCIEGGELDQARHQWQEHLVASFETEGQLHSIVEAHARALIDGIARAYKVTIHWMEHVK